MILVIKNVLIGEKYMSFYKSEIDNYHNNFNCCVLQTRILFSYGTPVCKKHEDYELLVYNVV
jgi:hypothetical protein